MFRSLITYLLGGYRFYRQHVSGIWYLVLAGSRQRWIQAHDAPHVVVGIDHIGVLYDGIDTSRFDAILKKYRLKTKVEVARELRAVSVNGINAIRVFVTTAVMVVRDDHEDGPSPYVMLQHATFYINTTEAHIETMSKYLSMRGATYIQESFDQVDPDVHINGLMGTRAFDSLFV